MDKLPNLTVAGLPRRFGGPNGYGHHWDGQQRKTPLVRLAARLGWSSSSPSKADMRPLVMDVKGPGILDQGPTSSCVGHAHVGSVMTRLLAMGIPAPYLLSPTFAYLLARIVDRQEINGVLPPITDDGSMPNACVRGIAEWGVCSFDMRPTDPATINDEPKILELEQSFIVRPRGIYEVLGTGQAREDQIKAALANGFPLTIAAIVDPAFENWSGGDPIDAPDLSQALGGHDIYLVGYETLSNGTVVYFIANSWGRDWAESGFARVSSRWIQAAMDIEAVELDQEAA